MSRFARLFLVFAALSPLATSPAHASFISNSPDPMLGGDLITAGNPISSPFGYVTFTIANIVEISNTVSNGNDYINYSASPVLTFYSDSTLTTALTSATFQGQFTIEILGRTTPFQTGTFNFLFLSSTASGTISNTPVSVQLDPTQPSQGMTSIVAGPGIGDYTINTTATQYSQFSVNGGSPIGIPPLALEGITAVPEPASLAMLAMGLAALGIASRRYA